MSIWSTRKIKDVGEVVTGSTPPTKDVDNFGSGYLFIKPPDLSENTRKVFSTLSEISELGAQTQIKKLLPANTPFVVCIGTIGKTGITTRPSFTNQQINSIVVNQTKYDPLFIYYRLRSIVPVIQTLDGGSASGRENVNKSTFESIEILVPDLPTQKKIAGILSAYDDLIENNLRRIAILEEMAQSLYREWFVHFRFPGHETVQLVDSELGKIPEGWEVKKLGEIAEDVRRGIPKGKLDEASPYVGLEHIPRKSLALDNWEMVSELGSNKLTFEPDEILFGKIRPYFHKVSVAPFHGICSADTIVIKGKQPEHHSLVTAIVSSEAFVAHASATANGAKMPRANWKVLVEYPIVQPPEDLLEKFSSFFQNVIDQQQVLVRQNQNLRQTRNLLLPKLLTE